MKNFLEFPFLSVFEGIMCFDVFAYQIANHAPSSFTRANLFIHQGLKRVNPVYDTDTNYNRKIISQTDDSKFIVINNVRYFINGPNSYLIDGAFGPEPNVTLPENMFKMLNNEATPACTSAVCHVSGGCQYEGVPDSVSHANAHHIVPKIKFNIKGIFTSMMVTVLNKMGLGITTDEVQDH